jgi:molybdopterin converting factor small subunit
MRVLIPSQLRSYTNGASEIDVPGATLDELIRNVDRKFRGFRFRIIDEQDRVRRHIRIFVNREEVRGLAHPLAPSDEVQIIGALSGG